MAFFTTPTGIAVIAAGGSFIAGLVGVSISAWTTRKTHADRLAADEHLADKKFAYERQQAVFKRRFEIAEQMLIDAYRLRSLMAYVRSGISFDGKGESRAADHSESDAIKRSRNVYFVPIERLNKESEFLSAMFARSTTCQAHFGAEAEKAYSLFNQALHQVRVASSLLIEMADGYEFTNGDTMEKLRSDIWKPMAEYAGKDEVGDYIDAGVRTVEVLCRPVLAWISST